MNPITTIFVYIDESSNPVMQEIVQLTGRPPRIIFIPDVPKNDTREVHDYSEGVGPESEPETIRAYQLIKVFGNRYVYQEDTSSSII